MKIQKSIFIFIFSISTFSLAAQMPDKNNIQKDTIRDRKPDMESFSLMKKGTLVPDFSLFTLDGQQIKFSELKGKTVFLNFFTLSCPMCMKELPLLEKEIWLKYKNRPDVVILAVGREEQVDKLNSFREKKGLTIPIVADPKREVYALFASQYVPRNIVIDKQGMLVLSEVGFTEESAEELFRMIEAAFLK